MPCAFQNNFSFENISKWVFLDFFIFEINTSKPSESTKKHQFNDFSKPKALLKKHLKAELETYQTPPQS